MVHILTVRTSAGVYTLTSAAGGGHHTWTQVIDGVVQHAKWLAFLGDWSYRTILMLNTLLNRAINQLYCFLNIKRLSQVLKRAALERRDSRIEIRKGRHDNHGQMGMRDFDMLQQI